MIINRWTDSVTLIGRFCCLSFGYGTLRVLIEQTLLIYSFWASKQLMILTQNATLMKEFFKTRYVLYETVTSNDGNLKTFITLEKIYYSCRLSSKMWPKFRQTHITVTIRVINLKTKENYPAHVIAPTFVKIIIKLCLLF